MQLSREAAVFLIILEHLTTACVHGQLRRTGPAVSLASTENRPHRTQDKKDVISTSSSFRGATPAVRDLQTASTAYFLACGSSASGCSGRKEAASPNELHEVRCCSNVSISGWSKHSNCPYDVWGESILGGPRSGCYDEANHTFAASICASNGGRLCTVDELLSDCTRGSGCSHDGDMIWSSDMVVPTTAPTDSPTATPTTASPTATFQPTRIGALGETGRVAISHVGTTISTRYVYSNPVVVAFINTRNGDESVDVRVTDVTTRSFRIFLEEVPGQDQVHSHEEVSYIVMEEGQHQLEGGLIVQAGLHSTSSVHRGGQSFVGDEIIFAAPFASTPAVLATLNTYNNGDFMSSLVTDVKVTDFEISQEALETGVTAVSETIGWMAFSTGVGITSGASTYVSGYVNFDSDKDGVGQPGFTIHLEPGNFVELPDLVVNVYGETGKDGSYARSAGPFTTDVQLVYAEEDTTNDSERNHNSEPFAWVGFQHNSDLFSISTSEPTVGPTDAPTVSPTTASPTTTAPTSSSPTGAPTTSPTTASPTDVPTYSPSASPSAAPIKPTDLPTIGPTSNPTAGPTRAPLPATDPPLAYVYDNPGDQVPGNVTKSPPLGLCEGDCDKDGHCAKGLSCFGRDSGDNSVPGCSGLPPPPNYGPNDKDYCYIPPPGVLVYVYDNGDSDNVKSKPLGPCEGDCDSNADCDSALGLVCFQRSGTEEVPGCVGAGISGKDYCAVPPPPLTYVYDSPGDQVPGNVTKSPPLGLCEGDCDKDGNCAKGLSCFQRDSGVNSVPGCSGAPPPPNYGTNDKDYCYIPPPGVLVYVYDNGDTDNVKSKPLGPCEGDCDSNADCDSALGLVCFQRSGTEEVPGCVGEGMSGKDYCALPPPPTTLSPTSAPALSTEQPTCSPDPPSGTTMPTGPATYVPGENTVDMLDVRLSTGLRAEIIAQSGSTVELKGLGSPAQFSTDEFHSLPDGAAVFPDDCGGGWSYVSNSEAGSGNGGVGAIYFNAANEVVGYRRIQKNTSRNCSGGKTPWGTWLTCEENGSTGKVFEVHPKNENPDLMRESLLGVSGRTGGNYEGVAYDNRDPNDPKFFLTEDSSSGPLERFRPSPQALAEAQASGDYSMLLHTTYANSPHIVDYLILSPGANGMGTFAWSSDLTAGRNNANLYFQKCEGIDAREGILYMTCKSNKQFFIIDLDNMNYTESSTVSGAFNGQPDQIASLVGNNGDIVYFCEDTGENAGVHGRDLDAADQFYTILQEESDMTGETTGLGFSPDRLNMIVAYQKEGRIYRIWREDGRPFGGQSLDIRYHGDGNSFPFEPSPMGSTNTAGFTEEAQPVAENDGTLWMTEDVSVSIGAEVADQEGGQMYQVSESGSRDDVIVESSHKSASKDNDIGENSYESVSRDDVIGDSSHESEDEALSARS